MSFKLNEAKISKEEYIEIKKQAYQFYQQYNSLIAENRSDFLETIPEFDSKIKYLIFKNTILFPDTEELLSVPKGDLYRYLKNISKDNGKIEEINVFTKLVEYSMQDTQQLIADGTLTVMEEIKYPKADLTREEYLKNKSEILNCCEDFGELELSEKNSFVEYCLTNNNYKTKLQVATAFLPHDLLIISSLEKYSPEQVALQNRVPVELINFKQDEYATYGTKMFMDKGILPSNLKYGIWYKNSSNYGFNVENWSQSIYKEIEDTMINKITDNLSMLYPPKTDTKQRKF